MLEGETIAAKKPRKMLTWVILLIVLVAFVFGVFYTWKLPPFTKKWQAVFLTNGQVYFGHLNPYFGSYAKLTNIYYLQVTQQLQPPDQPVPDIRLVKLGGELHGPEDVMYIMRDQILFWEYLRDDSRVVQGITQLLSQQR